MHTKRLKHKLARFFKLVEEIKHIITVPPPTPTTPESRRKNKQKPKRQVLPFDPHTVSLITFRKYLIAQGHDLPPFEPKLQKELELWYPEEDPDRVW